MPLGLSHHCFLSIPFIVSCEYPQPLSKKKKEGKKERKKEEKK